MKFIFILYTFSTLTFSSSFSLNVFLSSWMLSGHFMSKQMPKLFSPQLKFYLTSCFKKVRQRGRLKIFSKLWKARQELLYLILTAVLYVRKCIKHSSSSIYSIWILLSVGRLCWDEENYRRIKRITFLIVNVHFKKLKIGKTKFFCKKKSGKVAFGCFNTEPLMKETSIFNKHFLTAEKSWLFIVF
jgi:hypothetical protein